MKFVLAAQLKCSWRIAAVTQAPKPAVAPTNGTGPSVAPSDVTGSHHALLLSIVADELGCQPTDIGRLYCVSCWPEKQHVTCFLWVQARSWQIHMHSACV